MTARVTASILRKNKKCMRGARAHCLRLGLDFKRLVREGIPVDELKSIDDLFVQMAVTLAEEDYHGEQ